MKFYVAVDAFIADFQAEGRIRSEHTVRAYRKCLVLLGKDSGLRDPAKIGKVIPLRLLPDEAFRFAADLMTPGVAHEYLRRRYAGYDDPRLAGLLTEWEDAA